MLSLNSNRFRLIKIFLLYYLGTCESDDLKLKAIIDMLQEVFKENVEDLARVMFLLTNEWERSNEYDKSPSFIILHSLMKSPEVSFLTLINMGHLKFRNWTTFP